MVFLSHGNEIAFVLVMNCFAICQKCFAIMGLFPTLKWLPWQGRAGWLSMSNAQPIALFGRELRWPGRLRSQPLVKKRRYFCAGREKRHLFPSDPADVARPASAPRSIDCRVGAFWWYRWNQAASGIKYKKSPALFAGTGRGVGSAECSYTYFNIPSNLLKYMWLVRLFDLLKKAY